MQSTFLGDIFCGSNSRRIVNCAYPYLLSMLTLISNVNYKEMNCLYSSVLQNAEHFQLNIVCVCVCLFIFMYACMDSH